MANQEAGELARWGIIDYDDDLEDYEEDPDDHFDCHLDRNGFCGKAGSEECEFECLYRR